MAYTAEQKAAAIAVIHQHGGMTNAALDAVADLLGKRISTGTLHNWLSKTGAAAEVKSAPAKLKNEIETEKVSETEELADDGLDPQRLKFVDAYFERNFNGTLAAIDAGYSEASAAQQASRLLRNAKVQAEIQRRLELMHLGKAETQALMSDIAKGTMADFLTVGPLGWKIDLDKAQKSGKLHLVKKIRERRDGTIEIELYAKDAALRDIGKHHGLWKDGVEINIDLNLLVTVIDSIRAASMEPSDVFNSLLVELDHARRTNAGKADDSPG